MNRTVIAFALSLIGVHTAVAQSGLIEGPFLSGSGAYTTVPGGTFEKGDPLAGWSDHLNVASLSTATSPQMRGEQIGVVSAPTIGWYAVHNSFDNALVVGQSYVLSGFFRAEDAGGSIAIDIGNFGGQAWYQTAGTALQLDQITTGKWFFGYTTFTADNPTMRVRLVRNGPTIEGARNYFDDIAVTAVDRFVAPTAVPEPSSLLALGLGGLVLKFRKRANKRAL